MAKKRGKKEKKAAVRQPYVTCQNRGEEKDKKETQRCMCAFEREHDSYYSAQRESKRKNVKQNRSTGLRTPMYSHGFTFFPYLILLVQSELSVIESAGCASMKLKRKKKKMLRKLVSVRVPEKEEEK